MSNNSKVVEDKKGGQEKEQKTFTAEDFTKAKKLKEYVLKRFNEKDILTHFADQIFEDNNVLDVMDFLKEEKEVNPLLKEIVAYD